MLQLQLKRWRNSLSKAKGKSDPMKRLFVLLATLLGAAHSAFADDPCRSGLQPSQRPGPYAALVSVGPQRGQQHCFICEAAARPIVIVFARSLSDPLGKLVAQIDRSLEHNKTAELRAWVTFLAEDQTALDPKVVQWGQKHGLRNVPLAVFEDVVGPPAYILAREADITVLVSVKQRVVANFAFRTGELNDVAIENILKALSKATTMR
jgi:hypothetical protein